MTMTTTFKNRLVTERLEQALKDYPLYSQDSKKKDAICNTIMCIGNARWYILEGQQEGNDFTFYGIVVGLTATEYGYFSANEMADITIDASKYGLGHLQIEEQTGFHPCKLSSIEDDELQSFLSCLYDNN